MAIVSTSQTQTPPVPVSPTPNKEANLPAQDLRDPALYINRELSLLEFNQRVLEEAQDTSHPILERAKFLAIFSSNMDEFFMVRVAGLMQQVAAGVTDTPADGLAPTEQLEAIRKMVRRNLKKMNRCFVEIKQQLGQAGIYLHDYSELDIAQQASVNQYFRDEIFPILTPLAFDPGRPFPHISSLSLNLAVVVHDPDSGQEFFTRIKVPNTLPRLVPIERNKADRKQDIYRFISLEDLISHNLPDLFPSYDIVEAYQFRITRNADMEIEADEADDLLQAIEATVRRRRFGFVVRFTVRADVPDHILQLLAKNLGVNAEDIYATQAPLGQSGLMDLLSIDRPDLKDPAYQPIIHPNLRNLERRGEIFNRIRQGDILLHHPYASFMPVIDFLKAAARDPKVLAIKQTLYRAGANSPVVDALMEATENGKQVSALVELKARFDEESNIGWAKTLERVGVHVVYGFMSLKTHTKICMVVRREDDGRLLRYLHLSTGNYNPVTAQIYTDMGLFTCKPEFGADATDLFNALTGYSKKEDYKKFLVAPLGLRKRLAALIDREIAWAKKGKSATLFFQVNSLIDPDFIGQLYQASQAGVEIRIVARGICGLRPGIAGISDNIQIRSIVGRFLEHCRIYYFHNGGEPDIYLGSADLMQRNLDRRIETLFPIDEAALKQELIEILEVLWADNSNARSLNADGSYTRILPAEGDEPRDCQKEFIAKARNLVSYD